MLTNAAQLPLPGSQSSLKTQASTHNQSLSSAGGLSFLDKLVFMVFLVYVLSIVFEGPIRFGLSLAGLGSLIYLRDALAVAAVMMVFLNSIVSGGNFLTAPFIVFYIVFCHFLYGVLGGGVSLVQGVMGVKVFWAFIFALCVAPVIGRIDGGYKKVYIPIWIITVAGVLINAAVGKFPWEGLAYETAFGTVSTTKEWWAYGERRMPGLARASFSAAMMIGITAPVLLASFSNKFLQILIGLLSLVAIYLTTSKTIMVSFALAWVIFLFFNYERRVWLLRAASFGLILLLVTLPLAIVYLGITWQSIYMIPSFLQSLWQRFIQMWPDAFALINKPIYWVLGKGSGAIGFPQYFSWDGLRYNAADNIFVYLFLNFGLFSFIYISIFSIKVLAGKASDKVFHVAFLGALVVVAGYGISINLIEEAAFSILFGVLVGMMFLQKPPEAPGVKR